jgi:DNA-binding winged helix-turn-helix (wHTH) protein
MQGDFRIGERLVRSRLNAVEHDGSTLHLEPKVMQVLIILATHAGDVVTRQQIRDTVWQDVFVGEDVLIRAISELRRAFQDDPRAQHTIQTVPKVGYRLVAPVTSLEASAEVAEESAEFAAEPVPEAVMGAFPAELRAEPWRRSLGKRTFLALGVVAGLLLLVAAGWMWFHKYPKKSMESTSSGVDAQPGDRFIAAGLASCPILNGATYELENKKSGSVLEVPFSSGSNGTLLDQWKSNGGDNQRWVVESNGPYWTFTNVASGKRLDDPSAKRAAGIQVDQWQANQASNQNWIVLPVGDKSCKIISQSSGLLLDVDKQGTADGTPVIQYLDNDGANQHWTFRLVSKHREEPQAR